MNKEKICGMIGLAKRAGQIITGAPLVCERVRSRGCPLVIIASDAAENSVKRVVNCCTYYDVGYVRAELTTEELAHAVGKRSAVSAVAVTDEGFADAILKLCRQSNNTDKNQL